MDAPHQVHVQANITASPLSWVALSFRSYWSATIFPKRNTNSLLSLPNATCYHFQRVGWIILAFSMCLEHKSVINRIFHLGTTSFRILSEWRWMGWMSLTLTLLGINQLIHLRCKPLFTWWYYHPISQLFLSAYSGECFTYGWIKNVAGLESWQNWHLASLL